MALSSSHSFQFKRHPSMTLTSRSFSSTKSLNDIKFEKRLYQTYSSIKSLKAIQKQYQKVTPTKETAIKIQFIKNNAVQKLYPLEKEKNIQTLPLTILLRQKVKTLVHSLFMDLKINKKIQSSVRRQKTIVGKLYGWDARFEGIFFEGEDMKSQVDEQKVEKLFFGGKSGRHDSQMKSIYNTMRLFQAELRNFNTKKMNQNVELNGKSLRQSLDKFAQKMRILQDPEQGKLQIGLKLRDYSPLKQKRSLDRVLKMKKGTEEEEFKIDNFDLRQGENFDKLEGIVENGYMSCRSQV